MLSGYVTGYHSATAALASRTRELEARDYPTELSRKLLRMVRGAIEELARNVDARAAQGGEDAELAVMRHGQILGWLHSLVHLIGGSSGSDVPRWAVQPMKFEIDKYLKRGKADILIAGSEAGGNFAYDYRLDRLTATLAAVLGPELAARLTQDLPDHMAVFLFPFGERDNVLAHGAFFHEVAHQIDLGIRGISGRVVSAFVRDTDQSVRDAIRSAQEPFLHGALGIGGQPSGVQRTMDEQTVEVLLDQMVKAVQQVFVNWAREFCADLIATRMLGPAYAAVVVTSPAMLNTLRYHSVTHPATLLRLRTVLRLLAHPDAGDFIGECDVALQTAGVRALFSEWTQRCAAADYQSMPWIGALHAINPIAVHAIAVSHAEALAERVADAVVAETKDQAYYSPAQYRADIEHVLPDLKRGITINERIDYATRTHTPNEIATIYNVGIACYLREQDRDARERLTDLIRKSVELSQIQRVLQSAAPQPAADRETLTPTGTAASV